MATHLHRPRGCARQQPGAALAGLSTACVCLQPDACACLHPHFHARAHGLKLGLLLGQQGAWRGGQARAGLRSSGRGRLGARGAGVQGLGRPAHHRFGASNRGRLPPMRLLACSYLLIALRAAVAVPHGPLGPNGVERIPVIDFPHMPLMSLIGQERSSQCRPNGALGRRQRGGVGRAARADWRASSAHACPFLPLPAPRVQCSVPCARMWPTGPWTDTAEYREWSWRTAYEPMLRPCAAGRP